MKYTVTGYLTGSTNPTEVEAESPEEAFESVDFDTIMCHHCSGKMDIDFSGEFGSVEDEKGEIVYEESSTTFFERMLNSLNSKVKKLEDENSRLLEQLAEGKKK